MKNSSIRLWNITKPIRPHNLSIVFTLIFHANDYVRFHDSTGTDSGFLLTKN